MSNLRTLRHSIACSPTQNVKARAGYLQPLPIIDPRDWQTSTGPAVVPHLEEFRVALLQMAGTYAWVSLYNSE
jgi:hypothetical protein